MAVPKSQSICKRRFSITLVGLLHKIICKSSMIDFFPTIAWFGKYKQKINSFAYMFQSSRSDWQISDTTTFAKERRPHSDHSEIPKNSDF